MLLFPNAKINLGLSILNKREDGYHNLESVFLPVPLYDSLEFVESAEFSFESNIEIDKKKSNSVIKGYELLKENFDLPPISIYLYKNIPMGAGLGGGSSDGAFMLKGLSDFFELKLPKEKLEKLSLEIGSDCPFFIENTPKLVHGVGEILTPFPLQLSNLFLVLVNPKIHISTKQAFQNFILEENKLTNLAQNIQKPIESWKDTIINDFETTIFDQFPVIKSIKKELYDNGAIYASMTGTGSTVYGLFKKKQSLFFLNSNYFVHQVKL